MGEILKIYRLSKELNLYHIKFNSQYMLNMHFWRDTPFIRGSSMNLIDFMEYYIRNTKSKSFTYVEEYEGMYYDTQVYLDHFIDIPDKNKYDDRVIQIHDLISKEAPQYNCIVSYKKEHSISLIKHEVAHFLFDKNKLYKKEMLQEIKKIDKENLKKLKKIIRTAGYKSLIIDELQAYLSTGFHFKEYTSSDFITKEQIKIFEKPFEKIFNKYYKNLNIQQEYMISLGD